MEISFILTTNISDDSKYLSQFLTKIFSLNSKNFEVIIVDNYFYDNSLLYIIDDFFNKYASQIKVITSYKPLDVASSRNLGIEHASGKYLSFLHVTENISNDYFAVICEVIKKHPKVDIFEYEAQYEWDKDYFYQANIRTTPNQFYDLRNEKSKEVYAFISPALSTKLFNREVIIKNKIFFNKPIQFSTLFIYTFLLHAKSYYAIDKKLIFNNVNIINYDNCLDLVNQWVHILNYYSNHNLKKQYQQEIEYATIYYILYNFLSIISSTKNPVLIRKTYNYIKKLITKRHKNFRKNIYLNELKSPTDKFPDLMNNFDAYMKNFLNENKIKDDSYFWKK